MASWNELVNLRKGVVLGTLAASAAGAVGLISDIMYVHGGSSGGRLAASDGTNVLNWTGTAINTYKPLLVNHTSGSVGFALYNLTGSTYFTMINTEDYGITFDVYEGGNPRSFQFRTYLDGDLRAILASDANGAIHIGRTFPVNYSGPINTISGFFAIKTPSTPNSDESGYFNITSNCRGFGYGNRYSATLGGVGILLNTRTSASSFCYGIMLNTPGDTVATNPWWGSYLLGTGAWFFPADVVHTFGTSSGRVYIPGGFGTGAPPASTYGLVAQNAHLHCTTTGNIHFMANGYYDGTWKHGTANKPYSFLYLQGNISALTDDMATFYSSQSLSHAADSAGTLKKLGGVKHNSEWQLGINEGNSRLHYLYGNVVSSSYPGAANFCGTLSLILGANHYLNYQGSDLAIVDGPVSALIVWRSGSASATAFGFYTTPDTITAGAGVGANFTIKGYCTVAGAWTFPINTTHTFGNSGGTSNCEVLIYSGSTGKSMFSMYCAGGYTWELYSDDNDNGTFNIKYRQGGYTTATCDRAGIWSFPKNGHHIWGSNSGSTSEILTLRSGTGNNYTRYERGGTAYGYIGVGQAGSIINDMQDNSFAICGINTIVFSGGSSVWHGEIGTTGGWTIGYSTFTGSHAANCHIFSIIGPTSNSAELYINSRTDQHSVIRFIEQSTEKWIMYNDYSNDRFYIYSGSNGVYLTQGSSGGWTTYSDKRYKTNVIHLENALDKMSLIETLEYSWKTSTRKTYGVTAQSLLKAGLLHSVDCIDLYCLGVEYQSLHAWEIKAIQELRQENIDLRSELDKAISEINRLKVA